MIRRHVAVAAGGVIGPRIVGGRSDQLRAGARQHAGALGDRAAGDLLQQSLRRRRLRIVGGEIGQPAGRRHRWVAPVGAEQRDRDHLAPVVGEV